jgi:hypothetical protein
MRRVVIVIILWIIAVHASAQLTAKDTTEFKEALRSFLQSQAKNDTTYLKYKIILSGLLRQNPLDNSAIRIEAGPNELVKLNATSKSEKETNNNVNPIMPIQLGLSISVLLFGLILILGILFLLYKQNKGFGNITFKTLGIVLILTASLFLIVAGYSQEQITPVIGLLGTIAGFIFGSTIKTNAKEPD